MNEQLPPDGDPIERFFKAIRRGMRDFVANIADRVDQEIQEYIPDERHAAPSAEAVLGDAFAQVLNITTGLFCEEDVELNDDTPPPDEEAIPADPKPSDPNSQ